MSGPLASAGWAFKDVAVMAASTLPGTMAAKATAAAKAVLRAVPRRGRHRRTDGSQRSAEASMDIVRGPFVVRAVEDLFGRAGLDDPSWLVLGRQEEGTGVAHALRLLHVVGDDDDGDVVGDLADRILDASCARGVES